MSTCLAGKCYIKTIFLKNDEISSQQLPAPYKRLIDKIKQNQLREDDWGTDNLTNNRRLFNYDDRRIETHQLLITSLHSQ